MTKSYPVPSSPSGARVTVIAPRTFVGTWRFTLRHKGQHKPIANSAKLYCGADGRLKFKWAKNPGRAVMQRFILAANRAVSDVGGRKRICGCGS